MSDPAQPQQNTPETKPAAKAPAKSPAKPAKSVERPVVDPPQNPNATRKIPQAFEDKQPADLTKTAPEPKKLWDIKDPGEQRPEPKPAEPSKTVDGLPRPPQRVEEPAKTKAEPVADESDDELIERAVRMNIPYKQAKSLPAAALKSVVEIVEARGKQTPEPEAQPTQRGPRQYDHPAIPEYAVSLDEAVDESIKTSLSGLNKHFTEHMNGFDTRQQAWGGEVKQYAAIVNGEIMALKRESFENAVDKLPQEWQDFLAAPGNEKAQDSLFEEWNRMRDESRRKGEAATSRSIIRKAIARAFPEQVSEIAAQTAENDARDARDRFIARPTAREPNLLDPIERARKVAREKAEKYGIRVNNNGHARPAVI